MVHAGGFTTINCRVADRLAVVNPATGCPDPNRSCRPPGHPNCRSWRVLSVWRAFVSKIGSNSCYLFKEEDTSVSERRHDDEIVTMILIHIYIPE